MKRKILKLFCLMVMFITIIIPTTQVKAAQDPPRARLRYGFKLKSEIKSSDVTKRQEKSLINQFSKKHDDVNIFFGFTELLAKYNLQSTSELNEEKKNPLDPQYIRGIINPRNFGGAYKMHLPYSFLQESTTVGEAVKKALKYATTYAQDYEDAIRNGFEKGQFTSKIPGISNFPQVNNHDTYIKITHKTRGEIRVIATSDWKFSYKDRIGNALSENAVFKFDENKFNNYNLEDKAYLLNTPVEVGPDGMIDDIVVATANNLFNRMLADDMRITNNLLDSVAATTESMTEIQGEVEIVFKELPTSITYSFVRVDKPNETDTLPKLVMDKKPNDDPDAKKGTTVQLSDLGKVETDEGTYTFEGWKTKEKEIGKDGTYTTEYDVENRLIGVWSFVAKPTPPVPDPINPRPDPVDPPTPPVVPPTPPVDPNQPTPPSPNPVAPVQPTPPNPNPVPPGQPTPPNPETTNPNTPITPTLTPFHPEKPITDGHINKGNKLPQSGVIATSGYEILSALVLAGLLISRHRRHK